LRTLVDQAIRQRIPWDDESRCAGCGSELRDGESGEARYTRGCRTCTDRRGKKRRRCGGIDLTNPGRASGGGR
jgi:hypothetical protein